MKFYSQKIILNIIVKLRIDCFIKTGRRWTSETDIQTKTVFLV